MAIDYTPPSIDDLIASADELRNEVGAQSAFYAPGVDYTFQRWGVEQLPQETQETIRRFPKTAPLHILAAAFDGLLAEGLDEYSDEVAKAIVLLTVALQDKDLDKRSPLFARYGPWRVVLGSDQRANVGRHLLARRCWGAPDDRRCGHPPIPVARFRRWMKLAMRAWQALRHGARQALDPLAMPAVSANENPAKALSKEAKALAALADHPNWTDGQIAQAAGCDRRSLYRMKKFVAAKGMLKDGKDLMPKGRKDGQTGEVEAWDESDDDK